MVIFREEDQRRHAGAAKLTAVRVLERERQIGRETDDASGPIALNVGSELGRRRSERHEDREQGRHALDVHGVGIGEKCRG